MCMSMYMSCAHAHAHATCTCTCAYTWTWTCTCVHVHVWCIGAGVGRGSGAHWIAASWSFVHCPDSQDKQPIEADAGAYLPLGQAMQKGRAGGSAKSPSRPHAMIANAPGNIVATPTCLCTLRQSLAGNAKVAGDLIAAAKKSCGRLRF